MQNSPTTATRGAGQATAGLVLGIISMIGWLIPLTGFPLSILGIIFSAIGRNSSYRGRATAGLLLAIIALILTIVNAVAGAYLATHR